VIVARIAVALAGTVLVLVTLGSALKTIVVPRGYLTRITRTHFVLLAKVFRRLASPRRPFVERDRIMSYFAPFGLLALPAVWVALIIAAFTLIFWGTGVDPIGEAFVTSGSSLLTLGFVRPEGVGRVMLAFVEAGLGLAIVSLLISYLPTIYSSFSRREAMVAMLETRAGLPPSPATMLIRYRTIGMLDHIDDDLFRPWEVWFLELEESHTSQAALPFFRSPRPERSWVTAAGCVLDSAALAVSVIEGNTSVRGPLLVRTGFLALRRVVDLFDVPYRTDPAPDAPISISRAEFDELCDELAAGGIALRADRDQAWRDYAGWRVNYDDVLLILCSMVMAPTARWSGDRAPEYMPKLRRPAARTPG
jgi:hypothetical protein